MSSSAPELVYLPKSCSTPLIKFCFVINLSFTKPMETEPQLIQQNRGSPSGRKALGSG